MNKLPIIFNMNLNLILFNQFTKERSIELKFVLVSSRHECFMLSLVGMIQDWPSIGSCFNIVSFGCFRCILPPYDCSRLVTQWVLNQECWSQITVVSLPVFEAHCSVFLWTWRRSCSSCRTWILRMEDFLIGSKSSSFGLFVLTSAMSYKIRV